MVDEKDALQQSAPLPWSCIAIASVSPADCRSLQVYIGSFNSEAPIDKSKNPNCVELFEAEQAQLLHDLYEIPSRSCDRKVGS
jgi:EH domain-containing protein 1